MGGNSDGGFDRKKAELFEALGHPARIKIVKAMRNGPVSFSELKKAVGTDSSGHLAFHLEKLNGLVRTDSSGNYMLSDLGAEGLALLERAGPGGLYQGEYWHTGGSGNAAQKSPFTDSSGSSYARLRSYRIALAVILLLIIGGAAFIYMTYLPPSVQVSLDLTPAASMVDYSFYNGSPYSPRFFDIFVNGTPLVHQNGPLYPDETIGSLAFLPTGFTIVSGVNYNVTVAVYYSNGNILIKQATVKGYSSITFRFMLE